MINVSEYSGQHVGVFGLGIAGEAAVAALTAGGAKVWSWDDKLDAGRQSPVASEGYKAFSGDRRLETGDYRKWPWSELKALVLSPGVPLTHPKPHEVVTLAKQFNVPVIGELELLQRACPQAKYVAITGTNGKSTTTTLIGHILQSAGLKVQVGGNLGTPALALEPLGADGIYVLEMSSYQLDLVKTTRFNVAVFLNITPDHLDRHGTMENYVAAKMHIFDRQQAGDVAVIAVDDEYTKEVASCQLPVVSKAKLVEVSAHHELRNGIYVKDGMLYDCIGNRQLATGNLSSIPTLTGRHNWQNAAASYAAARACSVTPEKIYAAMKTFAGLRHRLQLVDTIKGVRFINDSKATNADATSNALAPFENIYWIAGGKPKEGGIESLKDYFPKIAHAFLIGQAEEEFADTLRGRVAFTRCGTLQVAVEQAAKMVFASPHLTSPRKQGEENKGPVVLLSPACASFDQWKNFEQRGDAFCKMVEMIAHGGKRNAS